MLKRSNKLKRFIKIRFHSEKNIDIYNNVTNGYNSQAGHTVAIINNLKSMKL